jgi:rare lipoprotein A
VNLLRTANRTFVIGSTQPIGSIQLSLVLLSLLIGACSNLYNDQPDGAGVPVDISLIADAKPIEEPITRAGNTNPYQQFNKTYHLLTSSKNYREVGIASWYGSKFHGRKTANGDIYDMYAMTAAHKTLPIPTYVRVTNLENQHSIIVRVNDRGPFHDERIIDLSYVAALKLGFAKQGTANVSIEAIDPTEYNSQQVSKGTYLQVGSFSDRQSAISLATTLSNSMGIHLEIKDINRSFKVLLGPIANDGELLRLKRTLKQKSNISGFTVRF